MDKLYSKYNQVTGEDILEDVLLSDLSDELKEGIVALGRGKACCHVDESWELISTGSDNKVSMDVPPGGLVLHGDPCYYFRVKIEGQWGAYASDNDASVDFTANPIWVQFLTKQNSGDSWTKSRSKQYNYSAGDTISFSEEFNFTSDVDLIIAPNISRYDDATLVDIINPIQNWARFTLKITVTKCLRTSWFNTYTLTPDGPNGVSVKQGFIPTGIDEGLPFDGWYEVNIRAQVTEEVAVGGTPSSLTTSQTCELRGFDGSWLEVDRSPTYIPVVPPNQDAVMGHSLQGSAFIYVSNAVTGSRDIEYRITLPNGVYKTLVGGYAHVKYLGKESGINSKD